MSYQIDLSLSPKELLIGQINYDNDADFLPADFSFGPPKVLDSERVEFVATLREEYTYTMTVWRMELIKLFNFTRLRISGDVDTEAGRAKILSDIAKKYRITLTENDFEITTSGQTCYLTAKPNSLVYRGKYKVQIDKDSIEGDDGTKIPVAHFYSQPVLVRGHIRNDRIRQVEARVHARVSDEVTVIECGNASAIRNRPSVQPRTVTATVRSNNYELIVKMTASYKTDTVRPVGVGRYVQTKVVSLNPDITDKHICRSVASIDRWHGIPVRKLTCMQFNIIEENLDGN